MGSSNLWWLEPGQVAGGECQLGAEVQRILVESGRACGVEISQDGVTSTERASCVISDIGVANTLNFDADGTSSKGVEIGWLGLIDLQPVINLDFFDLMGGQQICGAPGQIRT